MGVAYLKKNMNNGLFVSYLFIITIRYSIDWLISCEKNTINYCIALIFHFIPLVGKYLFVFLQSEK
jgi:hypothetical protein